MCLALENPFMRNQSKMTKYICELREHGIMHLSSLVRMFSCRGLHLMLMRSMVIKVGPWEEGLWIIQERNKWGYCLA